MNRLLNLLPVVAFGVTLLACAPVGAAGGSAGAPDLERAFARRDLGPVLTWLNSSAAPDSSPDVVRARAWLAEHEGELERARDLLDTAVEAAPGRADLRTDRARVLTALVDSAGALASMRLAGRIREDLERAVALAPDDVDAVDALYGFHLRAPGLVGGNRERAAELEQRLRKLAPQRLAYRKARRLAGQDRLDAAIEHLQRAVEQAGRHAERTPRDWRVRLARWYRQAGDYRAAVEVLEPLLQAPRKYRPALFELGRIGAESGLCAEAAVAALERFLAAPDWPGDPQPSMAWWQLGRVLELLGREREAAEAFGRALAMSDSPPAAGASRADRAGHGAAPSGAAGRGLSRAPSPSS